MRLLKEFDLVVEFGRSFEGEVGFLEVPSWRRDLKWVAEGAERDVRRERRRLRRVRGEREEWGEVKVRCVILTRGGEQS